MNPEYDQLFGQNLRRLRMNKGLTQERLAARLQLAGCDITRSALAKMEAGQRHVYPDECKALRSVLGVAWEELFP